MATTEIHKKYIDKWQLLYQKKTASNISGFILSIENFKSGEFFI